MAHRKHVPATLTRARTAGRAECSLPESNCRKSAQHPAPWGAGCWAKAECYLAYSVARLSRMTLTLIWPG